MAEEIETGEVETFDESLPSLGLSSLTKKIVALEGQLDSFSAKFTSLEADIISLKKRLQKIEILLSS